MKMKKEKPVKTKSSSKFAREIRVILILFVVVAVVIAVNFASSYALKQTVEVVKLKSAVPQDGMITEDIMYRDTMLIDEFEKQGVLQLSDGSKKRAIVLWEDRGKIVNSFASYYIRQNSPVYWDMVGAETPKQYSYLYKMDGELAKLDISADTFGEMLVPGDHINVRVSYTEQVYTLPTPEEFAMQQQTGIQAQTSVKKQDKLFNNVAVLDILNSNGESIFDIYYKLLALPKDKQYETLQDEDFQKTVEPSQILLNVTPEEADHYMDIKGKGPSYMMTLLPRTSGNAITEALNELQTGFARG